MLHVNKNPIKLQIFYKRALYSIFLVYILSKYSCYLCPMKTLLDVHTHTIASVMPAFSSLQEIDLDSKGERVGSSWESQARSQYPGYL